MINRRSILLGTAALGVGALGAGISTDPARAAVPSAETTGFPVLKYGHKNGNVKYIQARLGVKVTGYYGVDTRKAVYRFQGWNKLGQDGVVGPKTWSRLLDVVKSGSKGSVVKGLQVKLGGLSWDGVFGPSTVSAVKAYQKKHGLTADGVVGIRTWSVLMGASTGGGTGSNPKGQYSNGRLPSSALAWVGYGSYKLSTYCVADYKRMNAAFRSRFGVNLPISGGMSAYRTYDQQVYLWNLYLAGKGNLAARPGTSNHGWGLAADISVGGYGSAYFNWLDANGPSYGFNNDVAGEPWHWGYQR
ncbi:peptidoglycan-binding protein [Propionibacteriaceae bacterium Y1685]|uniref:peptidoglycan-binding protein n=1 Tax=Microlunatus sp. Y1700 TaxID=3418487 RepID=UPI003B761EE1